jgi:hypothetical protein
LLAGQVTLAEIERLEGRVQEAQALAEHVLADAAIHGDRYLEASAHWARAEALAMQRQAAEADRERARALELDASVAAAMGPRRIPLLPPITDQSDPRSLAAPNRRRLSGFAGISRSYP